MGNLLLCMLVAGGMKVNLERGILNGFMANDLAQGAVITSYEFDDKFFDTYIGDYHFTTVDEDGREHTMTSCISWDI